MTDPTTAHRPKVIVAGDMVVDHHLYEGERRKPDNSDRRGVIHRCSVGGANAIVELLRALLATEFEMLKKEQQLEAQLKKEAAAARAVAEKADKKADEMTERAKKDRLIEAAKAARAKAETKQTALDTAKPRPAPREFDGVLGVAVPATDPLHAPNHAFAVWRPHPISRERGEKRSVWRAQLTMGYGHDPIPPAYDKDKAPPSPKAEVSGPQPAVDMPPRADVLVLDDAGTQFRKRIHEACWHLSVVPDSAWILLKLSDPVAQGDLWRALVPALAKRLVVLVAADSLRCESVRIGKGLSWEQTLEDLGAALERPELCSLQQAAHLIVTFGEEAALWINPATPGKAHFCFDPAVAEGDRTTRHEGSVIGYMTCMAAALAFGITQTPGGEPLDFGNAMESGLRGMRDLLYYGHGPSDAGARYPVGFPVERLAPAMRGPAVDQVILSRMDIPWAPTDQERGRWMIAESSQRPLSSDQPRSLIGLAGEVLLRGSTAYRKFPHLQLGGFVTAERAEIEALRGIRGLIWGHFGKTRVPPLSIGVFGPPGAGKSFAVKQLALEMLALKGMGEDAWLEFNLSQFADTRDLIGAFHQVRDKVLTGVTPIVFWDEFDSQNYQWLRSLLAPMQDGQFQEGQTTHSIGHAVFIFAGGTAASFAEFGPPDIARAPNRPELQTEHDNAKEQSEKEARERDHWRLSKGPDFKSRLDAFYNVVGPNCRRIENTDQPDRDDIGYPMRRAFFIRGKLGFKDSKPLEIDPGLAGALLLAPDYRHGSRSLEKLVRPLNDGSPDTPLRRSALPPDDQIRMHVRTPDTFFDLLNRDVVFMGSDAIEHLAKAIHSNWLGFKEAPGEDKSTFFNHQWDSLPEAARDDNRAAARRIPSVLALAGLGIMQGLSRKAIRPEDVRAHLLANIECLAEAEHDGWWRFRELNGWRYAPVRDDGEMLHPLMIPYNRIISDHTKEKDRDAVRRYPDMVALADFSIVWLGDNV